MKKYASIAVLAIFAALAMSTNSRAEVQAGISISDDGVDGFYLAVGDHYRAKEKEMVVVRERKTPFDEAPVVFFIARRAKASPESVINLRLAGKSWMEISIHFGITADAYYVPVKHNPGPPYGKAYGHFKNKKNDQWKKVVLSDGDIVNFVNLRFISDHYGYSHEEVMKLRGDGMSFTKISSRAKKAKNEKLKSKELASKDKRSAKSGNKKKGKK